MSAIINTLVEEFQDLSLDEQEYLAELFKKQILDARRDRLAKRVSESRRNYKKGQCKSGSLKDLMEDLDND